MIAHALHTQSKGDTMAARTVGFGLSPSSSGMDSRSPTRIVSSLTCSSSTTARAIAQSF